MANPLIMHIQLPCIAVVKPTEIIFIHSTINAQHAQFMNAVKILAIILATEKQPTVVMHAAQCIGANHHLSFVPIYSKIIIAEVHDYCQKDDNLTYEN